MTYPQFPTAPAQPEQQYAPPAQGYAPAQYPAQQPGFPMAPQQYQPQQYQPQQYQPQQYAVQPSYQGPQQPAVPLAQGSLDAFYSQPSVGGGAGLKFEVNTSYVLQVTRAVTGADVQQQTNPQNQQPVFYKDGRPKFVMKVPVQIIAGQNVPAGAQYIDQKAQWYCAGQARDELSRAMAEVGAPAGPPEAGSTIAIACTGTRPSGPGMNPAKNYAIQYRRPDGAAVSAPAAAPAQPVAAAPPVAPPVPTAVQQPVAQAQPPAAAMPPGMTPEQQALIASLSGQKG